MYFDHLKLCVFMVETLVLTLPVYCGECNVVSNEHTHCLVRFCFRSKLGFLNYDYKCMCVVNKQFELLEFVFDSVYVDLQYEEISLTFTAGSVCLCGLCSHVLQGCGWCPGPGMVGGACVVSLDYL